MTARLPLTKYHQIYLVLREQLQEGRFAQGMPAEVELARQFGVGRVTVRHAMEQLVAEGGNPAVVNRVAQLLQRAEFKRRQAAPALKVSGRAFGSGWRFPIAAG